MVKMMNDYKHKNNNGSAFRNKRKAEPFHADFSGTAMIDDEEYFVNVWLKDAKDGDKYVSFSVKKKSSLPKKAEPFPATKPNYDDDAMPF